MSEILNPTKFVIEPKITEKIKEITHFLRIKT